MTALDAALFDWRFLWERGIDNMRPVQLCPNCGRAGQILIHATDGSTCCPECRHIPPDPAIQSIWHRRIDDYIGDSERPK